MGRGGEVRLGYVNIQGELKKKLGLKIEVMTKKGISVMGLRETNMKREGLGISWEEIEWIASGMLQRVEIVGVLERQDLIYQIFKSGGKR